MYQNAAGKGLIEEFAAREQSALEGRKAHAAAAWAAGSFSKFTSADLKRLADELSSINTSTLTTAFQKNVTFGWMNFLYLVAIGKPTLEVGKGKDPFDASNLPDHGELDHYEACIDVTIALPTSRVGGLKVKAIGTGASDATARVLRNIHPKLMNAPVTRRIWLDFGDGPVSRELAMIIYPDGSLRLNETESTPLPALAQPYAFQYREASKDGRQALGARSTQLPSNRQPDGLARHMMRCYRSCSFSAVVRELSIPRT